jgi:hypothetical protein
VVNLVMYGKVVWCSEKFCRSGKFLDPWNGTLTEIWGGRSPKLISSTNHFFGTGRAQSEKVGHISFRPPKFILPVRPWAGQRHVIWPENKRWEDIFFLINMHWIWINLDISNAKNNEKNR